MILWLSVIGVVMLVVVASWRMLRRDDETLISRERDPHRGDWPPDQMAP